MMRSTKIFCCYRLILGRCHACQCTVASVGRQRVAKDADGQNVSIMTDAILSLELAIVYHGDPQIGAAAHAQQARHSIWYCASAAAWE